MSTLKKKIKKLLPDRVVYCYSIIQYLPKYFKAVLSDRTNHYPTIHFYDDVETVDKIVNERNSMSRFGDGEISWMAGIQLDSFQKYSSEFAEDLKRAFQSKNPKLLVGIPYGIVNSRRCNLHAKIHWRVIKAKFFNNFLQFADLNRTYCNASITRPYIDYRDREYSKQCFENIKRIWNQRDVVFVEGEKTKLGMGNDLFSNAKSIKRIICPAQNAYEKLPEIKKAVIEHVGKDDLIIAALGPAASILASDMCDLDYQIVDIGHIDIEYWWYEHNCILREAVPGKYVNESDEKMSSNCYDLNRKYLESIVASITSD